MVGIEVASGIKGGSEAVKGEEEGSGEEGLVLLLAGGGSVEASGCGMVGDT